MTTIRRTGRTYRRVLAPVIVCLLTGCTDTGEGSTRTPPTVPLPRELRFDAGDGDVGAVFELSTEQVDHGAPITVRKIGRRTYQRVGGDDARFSLPPDGWERSMEARVLVDDQPDARPSTTSCSTELAEALVAAVAEATTYGANLPDEDVLWAIAWIAEPAVTAARASHPGGDCDDAQAVVDHLPPTLESDHIAHALVADSTLDVALALAGAAAVIPTAEHARESSRTGS